MWALLMEQFHIAVRSVKGLVIWGVEWELEQLRHSGLVLATFLADMEQTLRDSSVNIDLDLLLKALWYVLLEKKHHLGYKEGFVFFIFFFRTLNTVCEKSTDKSV